MIQATARILCSIFLFAVSISAHAQFSGFMKDIKALGETLQQQQQQQQQQRQPSPSLPQPVTSPAFNQDGAATSNRQPPVAGEGLFANRPKTEVEQKELNVLFRNRAEMNAYFASSKPFDKPDVGLAISSVVEVLRSEGAIIRTFPSLSMQNSESVHCSYILKRYGSQLLEQLTFMKKRTLTDQGPTFRNESSETDERNANSKLVELQKALNEANYYKPGETLQRSLDSDCQKVSRSLPATFLEISVSMEKSIEAQRSERQALYQTQKNKEAEISKAKMNEERARIDSENAKLQAIKSKRVGG